MIPCLAVQNATVCTKFLPRKPVKDSGPEDFIVGGCQGIFCLATTKVSDSQKKNSYTREITPSVSFISLGTVQLPNLQTTSQAPTLQTDLSKTSSV